MPFFILNARLHKFLGDGKKDRRKGIISIAAYRVSRSLSIWIPASLYTKIRFLYLYKQSGTGIGKKPFPAKFYQVQWRDEIDAFSEGCRLLSQLCHCQRICYKTGTFFIFYRRYQEGVFLVAMGFTGMGYFKFGPVKVSDFVSVPPVYIMFYHTQLSSSHGFGLFSPS